MSTRAQSRFRRAHLAWLIAFLLLTPAAGFGDDDETLDRSVHAAQLTDEEVLSYGWDLGGFKGTLARLIIPGRGGATLRTGHNGNGQLVSELNIFSPRSRHGDFQRYGARISSGLVGETLAAWSTQMFRGKKKEKAEALEGEGAVDIASSIWRLRHDPDFGSGRSRLWSGGNFYPIEVLHAGSGWGILAGRRVSTRSFLIRGVREEGERFWKGKVHLVLAENEPSTPLEIVLRQEGVKVRLALVQG